MAKTSSASPKGAPAPAPAASQPANISSAFDPSGDYSTESALAELIAGSEPSEEHPTPADTATEDNDPTAEIADLTGDDSATETDLAESDSDEPASDEPPGSDDAEAAEPAPDAQAEGEEEEDDEAGVPRGVQKRFNQLTARAKAAEEQAAKDRDGYQAKIQELEARLNQVAPDAPSPVPPAQMHPLDQQIHELQAIIDLADANPEGVELSSPKGDKQFYTPEQLRAARLRADRERTSLVVRREVEAERVRIDYTQKEQHYQQLSDKHFPFLRDRSTAQAQYAEAVLRSAPEIRRFANWRLVLGVLAKHLPDYERAEAKAAPTLKAPLPAAPRVAAAPARTAPKVNPQANRRAAALNAAVARGGREQDLAALIESQL